jgi:hypothetical protein
MQFVGMSIKNNSRKRKVKEVLELLQHTYTSVLELDSMFDYGNSDAWNHQLQLEEQQQQEEEGE